MRQSVKVNRDKLIKCINVAEQHGPLNNRSELYKITTAIYNKDPSVTKITKSIVLLRINEWGLSTKTPKGSRGNVTGFLHDKFPQEKREIKSDSNYVAKLKRKFPARYHKKCERAEKSRVAAIALACLDCSNLQPKEIALCPITDCPLYLFRPYKCKDNGEIIEIIDEESPNIINEPVLTPAP